MALVAYDYSDSDSEIESENEKSNENEKTSFCELFLSLPKPKEQTVIEEETDDILLNTNETKTTGKKEPVKIAIPALSNYNSDEEEPPKKIITNIPEKASGLFAILPNPKCTPVDRNSKFDAAVVKQKNLVPRTVKTKPATKRQIDSDDEEISGSNFFSSILTDTKPVSKPTVLNMQVDSAKRVRDVNSKSNSFFAELVANTAKKSTETPAEEEEEKEEEKIEEKAVEELCGKRNKRAKKRGVKIVDINADDMMPDSREWKTKALTEEDHTPAVKKGEEPSSQSRRKHQITYLAYQAKVNEQDLKNQWAMNRMTRKQTQAKYGF